MKNKVGYVKDVTSGALSVAIEVTIVYNDSCETEKLTLLRDKCTYKAGDPLSEADILTLHAEGELFVAVMHGIRLLGYSDQSVRALTRKLVGKGYSRLTAESAAREIERLGYINETEQVMRRARAHTSKLKGQRLVISELYADGYGKETISHWLERDDTDYGSLCARAIRKKGGLPEKSDTDARKKLISHLYRRGFTSFDIKEAVKILSDEDE